MENGIIFLLACQLQEFAPFRINRIIQGESDTIIFECRLKKDTVYLAISTHPDLNGIFPINRPQKINSSTSNAFLLLLRKKLQGGFINKVLQLNMDKIISLEVSKQSEYGTRENLRLIIELTGKNSNIILLSEENVILDCLRRIPPSVNTYRTILPTAVYSMPPDTIKRNPFDADLAYLCDYFAKNSVELNALQVIQGCVSGINRYMARRFLNAAGLDSKTVLPFEPDKLRIIAGEILKYFDNLKNARELCIEKENTSLILTALPPSPLCIGQSSECLLILQDFYKLQMDQRLANKLHSEIARYIQKNRSNLKEKLVKARAGVKDDAEIELKRILAEHLLAFPHQAVQDHLVEVPNLYEDSPQSYKIAVNPELSLPQNAQKYYKQYGKEKRAKDASTIIIEEINAELAYLADVEYALENSSDVSDLESLREELFGNQPSKAKASENRPSKNLYRRYRLPNGSEVFAGRNNIENDLLTLRLADKEHWWFHAKDFPGSHVILFVKDNKLSEENVQYASMIAAFNSKGKNGSNVPVDYTKRKNVKKPAKAKPGKVIYSGQQTFYVTPEASIITELEKAYVN
jgi:predicted ribosome quality control (RQC) complex YloA/Tae2 family protein